VTFDLDPTGGNLGTGYSVATNIGLPSPETAGYGGFTTFQLPPGTAGSSADIIITVTDLDNPDCEFELTIPNPGACSTPCEISPVVQSVDCDDNNSPTISGDDQYFVEVLINGSGSGWIADDPTNSSGIFGTVAIFGPFLISDGPVSITITSADDPTCQEVFVVDPPPTCSDLCDIQATLIETLCDDNGTPTDTTDDVFTAEVTVIGTGTGWTADDPAASTGIFGATAILGPFAIADGPLVLTFTSIDNADCESTLPIDPPAVCSQTCTIQGIISDAVCDDNNTPGTSADDTFVAVLNVTGQNNSSSWTADPPIDASGLYDLPVAIGPFPTSQGNLSFTVTDDLDPSCTTTVLLATTGSCSDGCPTPDTTLLSGTSCNIGDTGTVVFNLINSSGCDSIVINTIIQLPSDTMQLLNESCNPADTGVVETLFQNQFGCDSLVIETTVLLPGDTVLLELFSCNPSDTGRVETLLQNRFGCDSLVITQTEFRSTDTTFVSLASCSSADTGVVETLFQNQFGCDSLVIEITSLLPSDTLEIRLFSCNPADTGRVESLFQNQFGCDSLVITQTDFRSSDTTFIELASCNPADIGVVETLFQNQFGCDSLIIETTSLIFGDTTFLQQSSCNPLDTGIAQNLLTNQFGCDSLIVTTTTLLQSDTTQLIVESCNPLDTGTIQTILTNQFGCDSLVIVKVTLLESPTSNLIQNLCFGESLTINGTVYDADNPTGTDTLSATNGCDSLVFIELFFSPPPDEEQIDTVLCEGERIIVNGIIYDAQQPNGSQVVLNQNGCDSLIITINVAFNNLNIESIVSQPDCAGENGGVEVLGIELGIPPYSLQFGDDDPVVIEGFPYLISEVAPGEYLLEVEDSLGCVVTETVQIIQGPEAIVDLGADIEATLGDQIQLSPTITFDYDSLIWSPADVLTCVDCLNPTVISTQSVSITLIAFNEEGCEGEDEVQIIFLRRSEIYAPNAFSPNGDGINDFFTIYTDNTEEINIRTLNIYNRWGDQVFERANLTPGALSEGWDGTFLGQPLDPAVFVFVAEVEFSDGNTEIIKGDISLMR
jgi:gliding motility-associated-like protein